MVGLCPLYKIWPYILNAVVATLDVIYIFTCGEEILFYFTKNPMLPLGVVMYKRCPLQRRFKVKRVRSIGDQVNGIPRPKRQVGKQIELNRPTVSHFEFNIVTLEFQRQFLSFTTPVQFVKFPKSSVPKHQPCVSFQIFQTTSTYKYNYQSSNFVFYFFTDPIQSYSSNKSVSYYVEKINQILFLLFFKIFYFKCYYESFIVLKC